MDPIRVLLVDDDPSELAITQAALESRQFKVTPAKGVTDALSLMTSDSFDVLVTDQRMPGDGDGFTLVSAMRSVQPHALTVLTSGTPDPEAAMAAIAKQPHEIIEKSRHLGALGELINKRIANLKGSTRPAKEAVAGILHRKSAVIVADWLDRVRKDSFITRVQLDDKDRVGHLPRLIEDLVVRLSLALGGDSHAAISSSAVEHGLLRYRQGYSLEMIVDESRLLQVSIFHELHNNLGYVDMSVLLIDIMTIADEVDSQLKQTVAGYLKEARTTART